MPCRDTKKEGIYFQPITCEKDVKFTPMKQRCQFQDFEHWPGLFFSILLQTSLISFNLTVTVFDQVKLEMIWTTVCVSFTWNCYCFLNFCENNEDWLGRFWRAHRRRLLLSADRLTHGDIYRFSTSDDGIYPKHQYRLLRYTIVTMLWSTGANGAGLAPSTLSYTVIPPMLHTQNHSCTTDAI